MKEFKDEEGYKRASDTYRKLQSFDSPKVIAEDICTRMIIQEYLSGVLVSEMIIRGELDGAHLNQVRKLAMAAESNGISLDYFPRNFMVTKKGIVYVGDAIYEKNDENTLASTSRLRLQWLASYPKSSGLRHAASSILMICSSV